jgi:hypothetical protein
MKTAPAVKLKTNQVKAAGEYYVAAEIHRRGGYAVTFSGNMPGIDILASDVDHHRKVGIQVKTRTTGTWHANVVRDAHERTPDPLEENFWVFVDLSVKDPEYYIAPQWWIQNNIHEEHAAWLKKVGGARPRTPDSPHHAIKEDRILEWKSRWDVLGILPVISGNSAEQPG